MTTQSCVPVVCLIGSSRFEKLFHQEGERLEKSGHLVLMMSFFQHADSVPVSDAERAVLEAVDQARIDLADEVLVINDKLIRCNLCRAWHLGRLCGCPLTSGTRSLVPYIGPSTSREIIYARSVGKKIRFLNPLDQEEKLP